MCAFAGARKNDFYQKASFFLDIPQEEIMKWLLY